MNKEAAKDATLILLIVVAGVAVVIGGLAGLSWIAFQVFGGHGLLALVGFGMLGLLWVCIYCDVAARQRREHRL